MYTNLFPQNDIQKDTHWNVLDCPATWNSCVIKNGATQSKATGCDQGHKLTLAMQPMASIFAVGPVAFILCFINTKVLTWFLWLLYKKIPQPNIRASRILVGRIGFETYQPDVSKNVWLRVQKGMSATTQTTVATPGSTPWLLASVVFVHAAQY